MMLVTLVMRTEFHLLYSSIHSNRIFLNRKCILAPAVGLECLEQQDSHTLESAATEFYCTGSAFGNCTGSADGKKIHSSVYGPDNLYVEQESEDEGT